MSISYEIPSSGPVAEVVRLQSSATEVSPLQLPIWVQLSALVLWSLLLFVYGIQQGDLYRTEGLRAIIGKEMHRTGDWVIPRLYGEPILTKPPMFYWAIAATGTIFGEVTTWSSRLPAALAGMIAVLIVYFTIKRYTDATTALIAALALPCTMMWLEKASSSEIDTMLVMWVLGAWACFLRIMDIYSGLSTQHSALLLLFWWIAALLCVAGGVLTKWTGFLFFYVMAIPMLAWHRQLWRLFHWHHLLAALVGVAIVWCWLGAVVYQLGWSNVIDMLWKEGAPRVLHGQSASQHLLLETLVHPFKVLGIALPWSAIALIGLWRRGYTFAAHPVGVPTECGTGLQEPTGLTRRLLERSLWCSAVLGTVMMTIFPDHNIRQSFSLVPAWTLLGVLTLLRFLPSVSLISQKRWLISALLVWCLVKVVYVEAIIPARFAHRPDLASQAKIMQKFVPLEATLYLSRVKDECLMFNYGRAVKRIASWDDLPTQGACWCVLTESERVVFPLKIEQEQVILDAQGEKLVLCRCRQSNQALLR